MDLLQSPSPWDNDIRELDLGWNSIEHLLKRQIANFPESFW